MDSLYTRLLRSGTVNGLLTSTDPDYLLEDKKGSSSGNARGGTAGRTSVKMKRLAREERRGVVHGRIAAASCRIITTLLSHYKWFDVYLGVKFFKTGLFHIQPGAGIDRFQMHRDVCFPLENSNQLLLRGEGSDEYHFLRELIRNASDALDKRKFSELSTMQYRRKSAAASTIKSFPPDLPSPNVREKEGESRSSSSDTDSDNDVDGDDTAPAGAPDEPYSIRVVVNEKAKTLSVIDNGIGMTDRDMIDKLGTQPWGMLKQRGYLESVLVDALRKEKEKEGVSGKPLFAFGFLTCFSVAKSLTYISRGYDEEVDLLRSVCKDQAPRERDFCVWRCNAGDDRLDREDRFTFEVSNLAVDCGWEGRIDKKGERCYLALAPSLTRHKAQYAKHFTSRIGTFGTEVTLHIKDEYLHLLSRDRLLKSRNGFCPFNNYDVNLFEVVAPPIPPLDDKSADPTFKYSRLSSERPIWLRDSSQIKRKEYERLFRKTFRSTDSGRLTSLSSTTTTTTTTTSGASPNAPLSAMEEESVPDRKKTKKRKGEHHNKEDCLLGLKHFQVQGQLEFTAVLFVPRYSSSMAVREAKLQISRSENCSSSKEREYEKEQQKQASSSAKNNNIPQALGLGNGGIKLFVRHQFVMDCVTDDEGDGLLPSWLGEFVEGIVDSEDLPLNIRPSTLQQNKIIKVIRKNLVKKLIELFSSMQADFASSPPGSKSREDYLCFHRCFGKNLRRGALAVGVATTPAATQQRLQLLSLMLFTTVGVRVKLHHHHHHRSSNSRTTDTPISEKAIDDSASQLLLQEEEMEIETVIVRQEVSLKDHLTRVINARESGGLVFLASDQHPFQGGPTGEETDGRTGFWEKEIEEGMKEVVVAKQKQILQHVLRGRRHHHSTASSSSTDDDSHGSGTGQNTVVVEEVEVLILTDPIEDELFTTLASSGGLDGVPVVPIIG